MKNQSNELEKKSKKIKKLYKNKLKNEYKSK